MNVNRIIFFVLFFILIAFISLSYMCSKERGFLLYKSVSILINNKEISTSVAFVDADFSSISIIDDSSGKWIKIAKFVNPSKLSSSLDNTYSKEELKSKKGLNTSVINYDDSETAFSFAIYSLYIMILLYLLFYASYDYIFIRDFFRNRTKVPLTYYSEDKLRKRLGDILNCHHCENGQQMKLTKEIFQDSMQMIHLLCPKCEYEKDVRVDKV